jgi:hypothetical protein
MEIFDFGVGFPVIDEGNAFFINCLKIECDAHGMKFIFIDAASLDSFTAGIKNGSFKLHFYLDMASETFILGDAYLKFNYLLKDAGTRIVADPDDVKTAADKSVTHFDLMRAGISVPFTVLIRSGESPREFTGEEKEKLGHPIVVKPALGYGQRGVKITAYEAIREAIAEARKVNMGDTVLVQEFIEPREIEGSLAWFRVFNTFGEITPCWWNPHAHTYREVTLGEVYKHKLLPMIQITAEIARITRVEWFSCEVAINKKNNEFVAIDYMNDQCWVNPQSKSDDGIPDDIIAHIAGRIVEKARDCINRRSVMQQKTDFAIACGPFQKVN